MNTNTERARVAARVSVGLATGVLAFGLGAGLAGAKPVGPTDIAPCPPHGWHVSPGAPATAVLPGRLVAPVGPKPPLPTLSLPTAPPAPPTLTAPPSLTLPPPVGDPLPGDPPVLTPAPPDQPCGHPGTPPAEPSDEPGHGDEATPTPQPTPPPGPGGGSGGGQAQGGSLAHTGTNAALLTVAGGVLLGGGAGLLALARRMRRRVG
jgi:LPXTG-motif cell wall-anchored protein